MILSCPACATRFQIDDTRLSPGGRKLRCGQCRHVWSYKPTPEGADPTSDAASGAQEASSDKAQPPIAIVMGRSVEPGRLIPNPDDRDLPRIPRNGSDEDAAGAPDRKDEKGGKSSPFWYFFVILIVFALLVGAILLREDVVRLLPQMAAFYDLIGLPAGAPAP